MRFMAIPPMMVFDSNHVVRSTDQFRIGRRKAGGRAVRKSAGATRKAIPTGREIRGTGAGATARRVSDFTDSFAAVLSQDAPGHARRLEQQDVGIRPEAPAVQLKKAMSARRPTRLVRRVMPVSTLSGRPNSDEVVGGEMGPSRCRARWAADTRRRSLD